MPQFEHVIAHESFSDEHRAHAHRSATVTSSVCAALPWMRREKSVAEIVGRGHRFVVAVVDETTGCRPRYHP